MFYDDVFQGVFEGTPFSETFTLTLDASWGVADFDLTGFFYSGTSGDDTPAQAYAPRKARRSESFEFARKSLPDAVTDPKRMLQGAVISSDDRGAYRVIEVRGERSGVLTLVLNPYEGSASDVSYVGISGSVVGVKA